MLIHPLAERLRAVGMAAMADAFLEMQNQSAATDLTREDWLGLAQPPGKALAVARGHFPVEQQTEPVLACEIGRGRLALHFQQRIGHGGHSDGAQPLGQRVD